MYLAAGCHYAITFRQAHGYLPIRRASLSYGQYQIILLGDRGTSVWTTCPRSLREGGSDAII